MHTTLGRTAVGTLGCALLSTLACVTTPTKGPPEDAAPPGEAGPEPGLESFELGAVDFEVSCDPAVRGAFDRALALMHHMMYVQARSAFERISEAAPECAMAYWGIATTLFQPLWGTRPSDEDLARGARLVERARELEPGSERERLLLAATAAYFNDGATLSDRRRRWAEGMAAAYREHPEDHDTAALYALSRLALAQEADEPGPLHDEAEAILRAIWEQEPRHPGAVHYTIHATDADGRARNALDIVESYNRIAPEVPHALHMPSHIYVRLGDWPAVIEWNQRSAEAALRAPADGAVSHHYIHAMDYLLYARLQRAEDEQAEAVVGEAMSKGRYQPTIISAYHAAAMPARLAVERRRWEDAKALEPRTPDYLPWDEGRWPEGITWFARGLGAVRTKNLAMARRAVGRLAELRDAARAEANELFATNIEIDRGILDGWISQLEDDPEEAARRMRSAAELEATVEKHPVTPGALLPANEALGDLLVEQGRPKEALAAYQASDAVWPNRFNSLLGAARAARAANDPARAREYYGRLVELAGSGKRPALEEARRYLELDASQPVPANGAMEPDMSDAGSHGERAEKRRSEARAPASQPPAFRSAHSTATQLRGARR